MIKCIYVYFVLIVFLSVSCSNRHEKSNAMDQQKQENEKNSPKEDELPRNKNNDKSLPERNKKDEGGNSYENTKRQVLYKGIEQSSADIDENSDLLIPKKSTDDEVNNIKNLEISQESIKYHRCGESFNRICTKEEIERIKLIQALIDAMAEKSSHIDSLQSRYKYIKNERFDRENKKIYFLGESHADLDLVIDNYSFIFSNIKDEDTVLLEGNSEKEYFDCEMHLISRVYLLYVYNEKNKVRKRKKSYYCPPEVYDLQQITNLDFCQVMGELEMNSLKKIKCRFWDYSENDDYLKTDDMKRNKSLADTALEDLKKSSVYIIAGFMHSPLGEYLYMKGNHPFDGNAILNLYAHDNKQYETKYIYESFLDKPVIYYAHNNLFDDIDLMNFPQSI